MGIQTVRMFIINMISGNSKPLIVILNLFQDLIISVSPRFQEIAGKARNDNGDNKEFL